MREEILALLEERAYRLPELAALLGCSQSGAYDLLCDLRANGHVRYDRKGLGWSRDAVTDVTRVTSPPRQPAIGHQVAHRPNGQAADVIAAVAAGARTSIDVAQVTGLSKQTASAWLSMLRRAGRIARVGILRQPPARPLIVYALHSNRVAKQEVLVPVHPEVTKVTDITSPPEPSLARQARRSVRVGDNDFEVVWNGHGPLPGATLDEATKGLGSSLAGGTFMVRQR